MTILYGGVLRPSVATTRTLHVGDIALQLMESCECRHKLNVWIDDQILCAPATTAVLTNTLHVMLDGVVYSICDGECIGGCDDYIMPTTPADPIVLPDDCQWRQTNPNAYLLSDGNQYFDTGVRIDSTVAMELTAEIVNGTNARLFGTLDSACFFDMSINANADIYFAIGTSTYSSIANSGTPTTGKHLWEIKNNNASGTAKYIYQDGKRVGYKAATPCQGTGNILIFHSNHIKVGLDPTANGGMKLYSIKMYDKGGTLLHDYQPVAAGTDVCGYKSPANAMYDYIDKRVYLPAGTGQMGYGVDG